MGVPVLTVAGRFDGEPPGRSSAQRRWGRGWICAMRRKWQERALELSRDRWKLRERRLQQRAKVAASPLLDHAGLAKSLAIASGSGGNSG